MLTRLSTYHYSSCLLPLSSIPPHRERLQLVQFQDDLAIRYNTPDSLCHYHGEKLTWSDGIAASETHPPRHAREHLCAHLRLVLTVHLCHGHTLCLTLEFTLIDSTEIRVGTCSAQMLLIASTFVHQTNDPRLAAQLPASQNQDRGSGHLSDYWCVVCVVSSAFERWNFKDQTCLPPRTQAKLPSSCLRADILHQPPLDCMAG